MDWVLLKCSCFFQHRMTGQHVFKTSHFIFLSSVLDRIFLKCTCLEHFFFYEFFDWHSLSKVIQLFSSSFVKELESSNWWQQYSCSVCEKKCKLDAMFTDDKPNNNSKYRFVFNTKNRFSKTRRTCLLISCFVVTFTTVRTY